MKISFVLFFLYFFHINVLCVFVSVLGDTKQMNTQYTGGPLHVSLHWALVSEMTVQVFLCTTDPVSYCYLHVPVSACWVFNRDQWVIQDAGSVGSTLSGRETVSRVNTGICLSLSSLLSVTMVTRAFYKSLVAN